MRLMVVMVMVLFVGCASDSPNTQPDAATASPDAATAPGDPFGAACDRAASDFCGGGLGTCAHDVCREQCTNDRPRCPTSTHETHEDLGSGMQCFCSPD
jgi:hypothetical protein